MNARDVLRKAKGLPTIPAALARLSSLLYDDRAGAHDFEAVVKPDPSLTANLLRLANSPFFGARRQISSVHQAIALLGIRRVFELAASASFGRILPRRIPGYEVESRNFWQHCIAVATLSERLAAETGKRPPDMTFTAGLLHDIGKIAIGSLLVEASDEILNRLWSTDVSFVDAEAAVLGTTHAEVGELMAEEWNLPLAVGVAARWHHAPGDAEEGVDQFIVDLVHVADALAHSIGLGADVGELSRHIDQGSLTRLNLKIRTMEKAASETLEHISQLGDIIGPTQGGNP